MTSILNIANAMADKLDLPRIETPGLVEVQVYQPRARSLRAGPPAGGDMLTLIARQAAARIEREDGHHGCAAHRLAGAYDGDELHRTALAAIELYCRLDDESRGDPGPEAA